jgi:hypothetical protein
MLQNPEDGRDPKRKAEREPGMAIVYQQTQKRSTRRVRWNVNIKDDQGHDDREYRVA